MDHCLRDHARRLELPLQVVSERDGIHLQRDLRKRHLRNDLLSYCSATRGLCRKPGMRKLLPCKHLLPEWHYQPVQRHLRPASGKADFHSRNIWGLPMLFLCNLRPEVQLLLRDELHLRQHHFRLWLCYHYLREQRGHNELPLPAVPERDSLHLPLHLWKCHLWDHLLPGLCSSRGLCRKPGLHRYMLAYYLPIEWNHKPVQRHL